MAGRGRGILLNELLKDGEVKSMRPPKKEEEVDTALKQSAALSGIFVQRPTKNPLPSVGRGLMTPNQFTKHSSNNDTKTSALLSTEGNLNSMAVKSADNQIVKSSPAHQQPPKIPFSPSPNQALTPSTTKEQTEADAEWQKYKFQRQILGILSNKSLGEVDDVFVILKNKLDDCSLSGKYSQFSEIGIILESLIEKATQSDDFIDVANILIQNVAEYDVVQFKVVFSPLISRKMSEYIQVTASDRMITPRAQRFCTLLGLIFKSVFQSNDDRFLALVVCCLQEFVEQSSYPDGIGSEVEGFSINKAETHAYAAMELFKNMALQSLNQERANCLMDHLEYVIDLLRESVMNEYLPRKIREVYLNLLLAYTPRWEYPLPVERNKDIISSPLKQTKNAFSKDTPISSSGKRTKDASISSESSSTQQCKEITSKDQDDAVADEETDANKADVSDESVVIESIDTQGNEAASSRSLINAEENEQGTEGEADWEDVNEVLGTDDEVRDDNEEKGPYHDIKKMLKDIQLEDQIARFEENVIRDTVLGADKEILKNILKEASFPAGVIYEILLYIDKTKLREKRSSVKYFIDGCKATSADSQFRYHADRAADTKQQKGSSLASRKRLLGIGRGNSAVDVRNKPHETHQNIFNKRFQSYRRSSVEEVENWRTRKDGEQKFKQDLEEEDLTMKKTNKQGFMKTGGTQEDKNEMRGSRQVGMVEPVLRSTSSNVVKKMSPVSMSGFESGPPACLRCGDKGHMSHECTDIKAMFI